ncbi:MAG: response regulator [bacterium]|nr:response regulator [bacterium]
MKVLIIDDSALARRMLKRILEKEDCEIIEAKDGAEGLEKFYLEKPDITFLDLTMEGIPGIDVLVKIKELEPSAKVIVATADIQRFTKEEVERLKADGFINKPFKEEEILSLVKNIT